MATIQQLSNPPITEALIDLSIQSPEGKFPDCLKQVISQLSGQYPQIQPRHEGEFKLEIAKDSESLVSSIDDPRIGGYVLKSEDELQVVQLMRNRFTFSRLKPYINWEELRDEAKRIWDIYHSAMEPTGVTRVAIRYINRLELPYPLGDFDRYLNSPPIQPKELPQSLGSFSTRFAFPDPDTNFIAIVNQAFKGMPPADQGDFVPVILDIDTFTVNNYPPDSSDIWDTLEQLRNFKNRIFFSSITERTLEPYK